jgi:lysophospholipase L1-like esterase
VINLGFSGNGRMEQPLVDLMASVDAAVYVIDCLPNMNGEEVAARTEPLVHTLRKARPQTPILLVEDRSYSNAFLVKSAQDRNLQNRQALQAAYQKLIAAGVKQLYYLPGDQLLGKDNLGTVDGSHPTDLGFMRMADAFEPLLKKILAESRSNP